MKDLFQFKQFSIQQDLCAMKVGTDSVLLGAWLQPIEGDLLDVGCGTGLISLMIAQRTHNAVIDAIDINEQAYIQTKKNIEMSSWKNRLNAVHVAVQDFNPNKKYDLIFANPPYFIDATKAIKKDRNTARHNDNLSFNDLVKGVNRLLKEEGVFALILPVIEAEIFIEEALTQQLFLIRKCEVKPNFKKSIKRVLMEFSLKKRPVIIEELTIETEKRHHYTKEYINLTQDFYLNF